MPLVVAYNELWPHNLPKGIIMNRNLIVFTAGIALLVGGCKALDTPTFQNNYSLYNREATKAELSNDWDSARRRYFLALQNAEWAEEGKGVRSEFHYKLGRAEGASCYFDKAQLSLTTAYEMNNRMPEALGELGRLNFAQGKSAQAIGYFDRAAAELAKSNMASRDPIGYAEILDDYKAALLAANRSADATRVGDQAAALRASNSGKSAAMLRPPYGKQCAAPKS